MDGSVCRKKRTPSPSHAFHRSSFQPPAPRSTQPATETPLEDTLCMNPSSLSLSRHLHSTVGAAHTGKRYVAGCTVTICISWPHVSQAVKSRRRHCPASRLTLQYRSRRSVRLGGPIGVHSVLLERLSLLKK